MCSACLGLIVVFCFLQSYHLPYFADKPLALAEQEVGVETRPQVLERAMHVLDQVPTLDTHKIGVIYVGEGQTSGGSILANTHGSPRFIDKKSLEFFPKSGAMYRYVKFLNTLGKMARLQDASIEYVAFVACFGAVKVCNLGTVVDWTQRAQTRMVLLLTFGVAMSRGYEM